MIDLHMHSSYSDDGEYSPKELVKQCLTHNIGVMSVTDHNCVRANAQAQELAAKEGIAYLTGIEIDCTFRESNFHVLGYGINPSEKEFLSIEEHVKNQETAASAERLEKTRALGFHITQQDLEKATEGRASKNIWTGEMFAEILLAKPEYAQHPLLKPYRPGGHRSDNPYVNFYWDYYAQGRLCHAKINYPSMEHVIESIHESGGLAVLAHPGINLCGREALLSEDILPLGLDGIEVFSSYHNTEQTAFYMKQALENDLFVTCGSDYHGKTKPSIRIGQHGCTLPDDELLRPFSRFL